MAGQSLGSTGSGSELGPSGGRRFPWAMAMRWCPAGSKAEGTAHSEDMARAEARQPRALADCVPGHSPDRASHKAVSTNPEQSPRAAWPVPGSEEAFNTCYPSRPSFFPSKFLELKLAAEPHAARTTRPGDFQDDSLPVQARGELINSQEAMDGQELPCAP